MSSWARKCFYCPSPRGLLPCYVWLSLFGFWYLHDLPSVQIIYSFTQLICTEFWLHARCQRRSGKHSGIKTGIFGQTVTTGNHEAFNISHGSALIPSVSYTRCHLISSQHLEEVGPFVLLISQPGSEGLTYSHQVTPPTTELGIEPREGWV